MRKRFLILLTALALLLCLTVSAGAGDCLTSPFPSGSAEAALVAEIAEALDFAYTPESEQDPESDRRIRAANRMLAEQGAVLCDTQAVLIAALQGYTAEDFRTAMTPVCRVARCPLYLAMGAGTAAEFDIDGAESFLACLAENEYDDRLLLARHVEADPADRAAVFLSDSLPVLTDVFFPEQIPDLLQSGEAALAVLTEAELDAAGDAVILFTLGSERTGTRPDVPAITEYGMDACPEPALFLMAGTGTDEDFLTEIARKVSGADLTGVCLAAGMVPDVLSGDALRAEIGGIFADYREYMTAEGLYFYE